MSTIFRPIFLAMINTIRALPLHVKQHVSLGLSWSTRWHPFRLGHNSLSHVTVRFCQEYNYTNYKILITIASNKKKQFYNVAKVFWINIFKIIVFFNPPCTYVVHICSTLNVLNTKVVVVNHCFASLFGTNGLLSDIVIRWKRCSQLMRWMIERWWWVMVGYWEGFPSLAR